MMVTHVLQIGKEQRCEHSDGLLEQVDLVRIMLELACNIGTPLPILVYNGVLVDQVNEWACDGDTAGEAQPPFHQRTAEKGCEVLWCIRVSFQLLPALTIELIALAEVFELIALLRTLGG